MNNKHEETNREHGNKHVKIEVRYVGKVEYFKHNYDSNDTVFKVKTDAMKFFSITANSASYCLQYEDTILQDALTLKDAGFSPDHERVTLDLIVKDQQDTDG